MLSKRPPPLTREHRARVADACGGPGAARHGLEFPGPSSTLVADLAAVRRRTMAIFGPLADTDLESQHDPVLSPLVWDLGHIAAYEDLWLVHRYGGRPLLKPEMAAVYDAFETPRAVRAYMPLLSRRQAEAYLHAVRERTLDVLAERGPHPVLHEMVLRHELQHTETMLQATAAAGLEAEAAGGPGVVEGTGLELVEVPGGAFEMGAPEDMFGFDNERPRHRVDVPPFRIGRAPVTNATWLAFVERGGYERREWWSNEGWSWKQAHDVRWVPGGHPGAPVCRVSWYEADAFARAHAVRLPREAEWEKAATWRESRLLDGIGRVWEWTATEFDGYPGFVADPYREYSAIFFQSGYRVLRGGSWATHPRVATPTFRNWDLPKRRQLFAGVRVAADAA